MRGATPNPLSLESLPVGLEGIISRGKVVYATDRQAGRQTGTKADRLVAV